MATVYDLLIIGAGSAGLSAADFALRLGAKVPLNGRGAGTDTIGAPAD